MPWYFRIMTSLPDRSARFAASSRSFRAAPPSRRTPPPLRKSRSILSCFGKVFENLLASDNEDTAAFTARARLPRRLLHPAEIVIAGGRESSPNTSGAACSAVAGRWKTFSNKATPVTSGPTRATSRAIGRKPGSCLRLGRLPHGRVTSCRPVAKARRTEQPLARTPTPSSHSRNRAGVSIWRSRIARGAAEGDQRHF